MGLPAVRGVPHTGTDTSPHVRGASESPNGVGSALGTTTSLRAIIESVFDPTEDRMIYERPADKDAGDDGQSVSAGTGLAVAIACVDAAVRLGQRRFVTLVAEGSRWPQEFAEEVAGLLAVRQRLVIFVPPVAAEAEILAQLSHAGWRIADCRERSTARVIAKELIEARFEQRATLIVIDEDVVAAAQQSRGEPRMLLPNSAADESSEADAATLLVEELQSRAASDPRLALIVLSGQSVWQPLVRMSSGGQGPSLRRVERELAIAGALSESGCRPIVVLEAAQLKAHREGVLRVLSRPGFSGVIVVAPGTDSSSRESMPWPVEIEQHVLPNRVDAAGVSRGVSACLSAEGPSVLLLPQKPVVGVGSGETLWSVDTDDVDSAFNRTVDRPDSERPIPFAVSAQSAQSDQQEIEHKRLRLEVLRWVQDYDRVGHRNLYLWRWCLHGIELTTFPGVREEQLTHLHDTKLLSVILCVLFDDVADRNGRTELLESLIQSAGGPPPVPSGELDRAEREYVEVTRRLWTEYESRVRQYAHYPVYERLWRFDLLQFLNTMRYAHLVNSQPGLLNLAEHDVYTPHNMLMVSFSTLDLMCVSHFDTAELGSLREAMWHAQSMGRIGNVLSTWRRELAEADQTSGMFGRDSSLSTSSKEQLLLEKWRWHRTRCHAAAGRVASIDLQPVLSGHDRFFDMHLASSGRI